VPLVRLLQMDGHNEADYPENPAKQVQGGRPSLCFVPRAGLPQVSRPGTQAANCTQPEFCRVCGKSGHRKANCPGRTCGSPQTTQDIQFPVRESRGERGTSGAVAYGDDPACLPRLA